MKGQGLGVLLVVPANNTTVEQEFRAYCPEVSRFMVARVKRPPRLLTVPDLPLYREMTLESIEPFIKEKVDLVVYGCTAAGFLAGPKGDTEITSALSDRTGAPTVSTAAAMAAALRQARVARPEVLTPYLDAVNEGLKAFLRAEGFEVAKLDSFRCQTTDELGRITSDQVYDKALETATPEGETLFIACSQLPTLNVLPRLREKLGRPVCSSVKATAWLALSELARAEIPRAA